MTKSTENFRHFLNQVVPLHEHDFTIGFQYFHERRLTKGEHFIEAGEVCKQLAFVNSGMLRTYFVDDNAEEVTYCFCTENHFETSFKSFIQQKPSTLSIQSLEDTNLLVINFQDLQQLYWKSKTWERIGRVFSEKEYLKMEEHASNVKNETASAKYLRLMTDHPQIIQKAPLNYIASYLGITPRHLSRLRGELNSGHLSTAKN
ncbi:Crp/Fnr family transcriptional regulator [Pseudochryseolinea flava]|uniref:Crp/Fnr family transcriptional regulator n=1 Tax=Pseudochryseolinea flava TaxID=2059302 RepID=A0A364Y0M0_9BACT|nr:Crp/Fnr family transcriptional regulator [Pseudochryseolinea flava]RAV99634.1 Crp/Fnr family transcriptional regulator [Pseudochryseolinea flava]